MNDSVNQETTETNQRWLAQAITLNNELVARSEKLKDEIQSAENLQLRDLVNFAGKRNSQTQAQLGRTQQQKQQLQQQLQEVTQELKECYQELMYTNESLVDALRAERLTPKQAREVAETLLEENEPAREAMVRLLNVIYGSTLKPWQLGHGRYAGTNPNAAKISSLSSKQVQLSPELARLKSQFEQFKAQFMALKSQSARLKVQQDEFHKS